MPFIYVIESYSINSSLLWVFETHTDYGLEICISKADSNYPLGGRIFYYIHHITSID